MSDQPDQSAQPDRIPDIVLRGEMTYEEWERDWELGDDDSLEAFVQEATKQKRDWSEMVTLSIRSFPTQIVNGIEWVESEGLVTVVSDSGNQRARNPSFVEVYVGCVQCGLHYFGELNYHGPARRKGLLGKTRSSVKSEYNFLYNKILSQVKELRFYCHVTQQQSARLKRLANEFSIDTSTMITAAFVAGLYQSNEWIPAHDSEAEENWISIFGKSVDDFWSYINRQDRDLPAK